MNRIMILVIALFWDLFTYSTEIELMVNNEKYIDSNVNTAYKMNLNILGKENLDIEYNRIYDEEYGEGFLDNSWKKEEIDTVLNAISGYWQVDEYMGFVSFRIYHPDLFDDYKGDDPNEIAYRKQLLNDYNEAKKNAQEDIPQLKFSIKKQMDGNEEWIETNDQYIYVDGYKESPIAMILSTKKYNDEYPVFINQTTKTGDFQVEYPVLYIKFYYKPKQSDGYDIATLVITADEQFFILIDGAFYSLKEIR